MGEKPRSDQRRGSRAEPRRVRLPGFNVDETIGLGDTIKRATSIAGIRPCVSCSARAERLNSWVTFTGKQQ
jgi:hypothetical protein